MTERQDELLNRCVDGLLSDAERVEFEAMMDANPELAELRDGFMGIGQVLRSDIEQELKHIDFTGFAEEVSARIDADSVVMAAPMAMEEPMSVEVDAQSEGFVEKLTSWWGSQWKPLLLGAAVAAAVALVVIGNDDASPTAVGGSSEPSMAAQSPSEGDSIPPNKSSVASQQATAPGIVSIDSVSFEGPKTVLVSLPLQEGEGTVIWLLDDEENLEPVEGEDPI